MRLDPVSLRLFVAVMDTGTIAAAAEREHIAPSAVSKRLSDLEDALGTTLVARSNRGIEPTAAGQELLLLARSVLNDLDNIHAQMRDYAVGARGLVRVHANISSITQFLPQALRSFGVRHPGVQVQLQERISTAVVQGVAANAADVGVYVRGDTDPEGLTTLAYRRDELVVVLPPGHALAGRQEVGIAEALDHDWVGLHTGSHINQELLKAAQAHGRALRCRVQVTSFDALAAMVESGLGIALMPRGVARRYLRRDGLRAVELDAPWAWREFRIVVRSMDGLSPAARLFVEHLRHEPLEAGGDAQADPDARDERDDAAFSVRDGSLANQRFAARMRR